MKKTSTIFTKNIQKVETVIAQEGYNDNMKIKIKYQTNKKYIMKRIEKKYYYRNKTIEVYNLEI